jgi:hypothetical protein
MKWAGYVARMRNVKNAYKCLVATPVGNKPFVRPRVR